jgi:branched-chain amino acid transport system substrate-binding protein
MNASQRSGAVGRRAILQAGAALVAVQVTSPFIIRARGETPVRIGLVDPITGVYAAIAQGEVEGARLATEQLNGKGGILGRPVELLVEDSANDVGTGVQKARKLIERDQVSFIIGDVNSGIAIAIAQVTSEKRMLHIVSGGHTDPITGSSCSWNVFRVCNTTTMDANAVAATLMEKFGKKWYFLTPDYAYGHSVQASFERLLKAHGGTSAGSLIPLGTPDFSAYLIQAKAYGPEVLIDVMGGSDQVNSLKQFIQFGLQKQMALGGTLFELESLRAVPDEARIGWWTMEWWWDQPKTPHVKEFNAAIKQRTGRAATARNWFGYASVHTAALVANQEKTLDAVRLARALSTFKLPPEIALQPGVPEYRPGDHELMSTVFVGEVHPPQGDPDNLFTVRELVPGAKAAGPVADSGCKLQWPT